MTQATFRRLLAPASLVVALSSCGGGGGGTSGQPSKRCTQMQYTAHEVDRPNISGVGPVPDEIYKACSDVDKEVALVRDLCADEEIDAWVDCLWDEPPSNPLFRDGKLKEACSDILASKEDSLTVRLALSKAGVKCFVSIPNRQ